MTSRREFFGLLAAAPIAVPAIAKAMTEAANTSSLNYIGLAKGERIWMQPARGILRPNEIRRRLGLVEISRPDGKPIRITTEETAIPNRLYGAQINADGDAV